MFGEARVIAASGRGQVCALRLHKARNEEGKHWRVRATALVEPGARRKPGHQASLAALLDLRERERTNLGVMRCNRAALL